MDNWRRAAKAPILVLNATTLNTGHNWQFTATWMGEPPAGINTEIDVNSRLRRMYYWQAPEKFREPRLGHAVAASAAVPLLFDPLDLEGLYEGQSVRLSDGGVHDNQGISALLGEDCTILLVSDASGQLTTNAAPSSGHGEVLFRANEILQERIRGIEFRQAQSLQRSRLVRALMFVHLTKDLDGSAVPWLGDSPPSEPPKYGPNRATTSGPTTGILRSVQRALSRLRTDLDSFTDREARGLMLSGYRMTRHEFPRCVTAFRLPEQDRPEEWDFVALNRAIANSGRDQAPEFEEQLAVGAEVFGKVPKILPAFRKTLKLEMWILGFEVLGLAAILASKASLQTISITAVALLGLGYPALAILQVAREIAVTDSDRAAAWLRRRAGVPGLPGNPGSLVSGVGIGEGAVRSPERFLARRTDPIPAATGDRRPGLADMAGRGKLDFPAPDTMNTN